MIMRRALGVLVLLAGISLWLPASDVLQLVLQHEPIVLGRYSLDRFSALLVVTSLLWLLAGLLFSRRRFDHILAFQVLAIAGSSALGVLLVALLSRMIIPPRYEAEPFSVSQRHHYRVNQPADTGDDEQHATPSGSVVHRAPGLSITFTYDDVPPAARTYPDPPPGYPRVTGTLTTDSRGFRNRQALERADVVTMGDSFTEGNRVSDEDAWPEVLARNSHLSVYNLGISLLAPHEYLNNFIAYGLGLKPETFILMFYEGNDFVREDHDFPLEGISLLGDSPLGSAMRSLLLRTFGSINANAPLPPDLALSWMPAAVRSGDTIRYYSFGPGRVHNLLFTREELLRSPEWAGTTRILARLRQVTRENNVRFILAYAPTVAHVALPLIREQLTDEALHAFAAKTKRKLPPVTGFKDYVYARLDTKENVLREFCEAEGIEFVSMTPMLRERMAAGEQVYYTYDSHWSPPGQHAAGAALAQYLRMSRLPTSRAGP